MTGGRGTLNQIVAGAVVVVLPIFLSTSIAEAQSAQRGRLEGAVRDTSGDPLPGVTVTATSPTLLGQRRAATDVSGNYVIRDLPRGDYTVLFEFPGLQSVEQPVVIEIGRTSRAEAVMDLAQFEDAVVVEASSPAVLDTTQGGANFTYNMVDSLAIERTPGIIAKLAPGVSASPIDYDQQVKISGGYVYDNAILVEGHDVADWWGSPVQGVTTETGPFIEEAFEETQVLTSTIGAEHGRFSGGVINVVTKSGGNDFSGSLRVDVSDPDWREETREEKEEGVEHTGERSEIVSATLGGPILRDKLWFFVAGRRNDDSQPVLVNDTLVPNAFLDTRYQVKLTGNLGDSHSLQATWIDAELDGLAAFPWVIDPRAVNPQVVPNDLLVLRYSGVLTDSLYVEGQISSRSFAFEELGRTDRDPSDLRNSPFIGGNGGLYNHPDGDPRDPAAFESERVAASLSWLGSSERFGSHDLKLGIEWFEETTFDGGSVSATGVMFFTDFLRDEEGEPVLDAQGRFQPVFPDIEFEGDCCAVWYEPWAAPGARLGIETTALYLNDRWVLGEHWSFNLGLRYETVSGTGTPGVEIADSSVVAPRLAVSVDPKGDGRYRLGASYSEYPGKYQRWQFDSFTNAGGSGYWAYLYTGPPGVGVDFAPGFDRDNYVLVGAESRESQLLAPGTHSAINDEWTVSAGMALPRGGYVEAVLIDRDLTDALEKSVTIDNGTTTLPTGEVVDNRRLKNSNIARRTYRALHVQGRYRLTDSWTIDGNWTWQLKNHGNSDSDLNGSWMPVVLGDYPEILPQERIAPGGRLSDFRRHAVRLWTNCAWSLGRAGDLDVSLLYRYDSPWTDSLVAEMEVTEIQRSRDPGYALPPEFQGVYFGRRGSQEGGDSHNVDLAARYSIGRWARVDPWIKIEARNVFNTCTSQYRDIYDFEPDWDGPLDEHGIPLEIVKGPTFGEPGGDGLPPREFFVSVGIRF